MKQKISAKTLYLIGVISIGLNLLAAGCTYAMFVPSAVIDDPITLTSTISSTSELFDTIDISLESGEVKTVTLYVANTTNKDLNYASWYISDNADTMVGVSYDSQDSSSGTILRNGIVSTGNSSQKVITIVVKNTSSFPANVNVGIASSEDSIVLSENMVLITNKISATSYNVTIKKKLGNTIYDISSQIVSAGDSPSFSILGDSSYPLYLNTVCTNNQTYNTNISTSTGNVQLVNVTLNSVSQDTVCIVNFYTNTYLVRFDVNYYGGVYKENYQTVTAAIGQNVSVDIISRFKNNDSIEYIKKSYDDLLINFDSNDVDIVITITAEVDIMTPGLNLVLGDPHKITIERIIPNV